MQIVSRFDPAHIGVTPTSQPSQDRFCPGQQMTHDAGLARDP
jgi:hypothetical protein